MLNYALGRLETQYDPRTLRMASYLERQHLPTAPPSRDWIGSVRSWPLYKNNQVGVCAIASASHLHGSWTANHGAVQFPSEASVIQTYAEVSGYVPETGANDRGCVMLDVLRRWRKSGLVGRLPIYAFASVDIQNPAEVQAALNLMGGLYLGLDLPLSAQGQMGPKDVWSVPSYGLRGPGAPRTWGGHAVAVLSYDSAGLVCPTWGNLKRMTWEFLRAYGAECYAVLGPEWAKPGLSSPLGLNLASLAADLIGLTG